MTAKNRATVTLRFDDGSVISGWQSFELRDNYTDPLGSFGLSIGPPRSRLAEFNTRLQKGRLVKLDIEGNQQAALIIQTVTRTVSKNGGVTFEVEAQHVLVTPYQGSVDPEIAEGFQKDTPIESVIIKALGPYGFDKIIGDNSAQVAALTGSAVAGRTSDVKVEEIKLKDASAQDGETAYGFAARFFSRLGLVLRVNFEGTLLLGSPDYDQEPIYEIIESAPANRTGVDRLIDDITAIETNDNVFSEIVVRGASKDKKGQKSSSRPVHRLTVAGADRPADAAFTDVPSSTIPQARFTYRSEGGAAAFKPFYKSDKFCRDEEFTKTFAHRIMGRHAENAFTVEGTVDGLISATGRVWTIDTVCKVKIDTLDIDENMWILETVKSMDRDGAQKTKLKLIPLNSLILNAP